MPALIGGLLRTRVDIATETQNQQLLEKLTCGQDMQHKLQSTVEGLSIAAISYYLVSLVLYGVKALNKLGLFLNPEMVAALSIPLVLWGGVALDATYPCEAASRRGLTTKNSER